MQHFLSSWLNLLFTLLTFRVNASEVEVLLGEHDFAHKNETDEIRAGVADILIHPQVRGQIISPRASRSRKSVHN